MKAKHILFFALAGITTFSACKKEEVVEEVLAAAFDSGQFVENSCSQLSTLSSPSGVLPTTVFFKNETGEAIKISWVNFTGELTVYKESLATGSGHKQPTYLQHPWYIETAGSECITIVTALRPGVTDTVRIVKNTL